VAKCCHFQLINMLAQTKQAEIELKFRILKMFLEVTAFLKNRRPGL
jgi:hypothetical protein